MLPSWHPPEKTEQVAGTYSKGETQCSSPFLVLFCNSTEVFSIPRTSRNFLWNLVSLHLPWCWGEVVYSLWSFLLWHKLAQVVRWMRLWRLLRFPWWSLDWNGCRAGRRDPLFYLNVMLEVPQWDWLDSPNHPFPSFTEITGVDWTATVKAFLASCRPWLFLSSD